MYLKIYNFNKIWSQIEEDTKIQQTHTCVCECVYHKLSSEVDTGRAVNRRTQPSFVITPT